jgi:hypothetical protein
MARGIGQRAARRGWLGKRIGCETATAQQKWRRAYDCERRAARRCQALAHDQDNAQKHLRGGAARKKQHEAP